MVSPSGRGFNSFRRMSAPGRNRTWLLDGNFSVLTWHGGRHRASSDERSEALMVTD